MPFPEDTESNDPVIRSNDSKLESAKNEYYLRLAAKACFNCPLVKAVDGTTSTNELFVYINSGSPEEVVEDVLWLFGADIETTLLRNTKEFGLLMEIVIPIDADDVVFLDTSDTDEYPDSYSIEDYIEDNIIERDESNPDWMYGPKLPDEPLEEIEEYVIAHRSTGDFREYHPTLDGETERTVNAWRTKDGDWKARYKLTNARAATCYSAIRKAIDYHHREGLKPTRDSLLEDLQKDN